MTESVTLQFTYEREDFSRAAFLNYSSPRRLTFDVALAAGLLAFGLWLGSSKWLGAVCVATGLLFPAMLFTLNLLAPTIAIWQNPKYRDEYRLTFAPEGIHFLTRGIESQLQWSVYTHARVNEHVWLLYYARNAYTIVPAHAFTNESDRARFEALVSAHTPRIERY